MKEMLTSLSERTLKERFFQVIKSITHEMLIKLCNIDYDREITIVAEIMAEIRENSPRKIIGIVGLMIDADFKSGEFGVIVHDHYQGKGIGYKLIDVLIGIAQEKGLEEFYETLGCTRASPAAQLPAPPRPPPGPPTPTQTDRVSWSRGFSPCHRFRI